MANGLERRSHLITLATWTFYPISSSLTANPGFPTGVANMGGGGLSQNMGELKMQSKNTCEGVYLIVKLPAISLQACKFTKNELLHTYFSRILARF